METGFFDIVKSIAKWAASLVEDKRGSVSTKRIIALWGMWVLSKQDSLTLNETFIWQLIVLICIMVGATFPEWFSKIKTDSNEK